MRGCSSCKRPGSRWIPRLETNLRETFNRWIIKLAAFLEDTLTLRAKPTVLGAEFKRAVKEEHGGQLPNGFPEDKKLTSKINSPKQKFRKEAATKAIYL